MAFLQKQIQKLQPVHVIGVFLVIFGSVLRLRLYTLHLSFWLDEAMLALNITGRTFAGLIQPLDYAQGAPLGFLWAIKLAEVTFGNNEYSLRLIPFLMSCLALFLLWKLTNQLVHPVASFFALIVFASSRYIVSYGVQVKQYSMDIAVTLFLYLLGLHFMRREANQKDMWLLGLAGSLAIWMSHSAVFTIGALGLVLIWIHLTKKQWGKALWYVGVSAFWALNFGVLYLFQYRNLASNTFLTGFWSDYFLPFSINMPIWVLDRLSGLFYNPGGLSSAVPAWLVLVLFFAGLVSLLRREKHWGWVLILSLVFTLAASALEKYPFGGRMGMFLLPGLLICAGEGMDLFRQRLEHRQWLGLALSLFLMAGLIFSPVVFAIETALKPKMSENIAPTLAFLKENYRPGDIIYLYRNSIPAFRYYASRYGLEKADTITGEDHHLNRQEYQSEIYPLAGNKRVWLLFSHLTDYEYLDDRDAILEYAGQIGEKKRQFNDPGTAINLYLYDFGR